MERQNPWWRGSQFIREDEDFVKWESGRVKWAPALLMNGIELKPFSLHFLYGARQVGKTTLLKLLISELLLKRSVNPKAVFYFRCEQLADYKELDTVITEYLKIKQRESIVTSYILLDEITFSKEWYRTIKWHIDMGNFKNDVLILTGSLSMFVEGPFPGRRGYGKDFVLHPLSFREFVNVVEPQLIMGIGKISGFDSVKDFYQAQPWQHRLNELLELYLQCGGFPLSIKSILDRNKITDEVYNTYLSWIKGDLAMLKRNESIAKRVIKAVIEKVPSPISLLGIAKEFEIKSHRTVFDYVDMLEKLYLAKILYFVDLNNGNEVLYKQRKIHLADPFLYHLFSSWCFVSEPGEAVMVESLVASHLARRFGVGYWKNKRELDIIATLSPERLLGVEVKWKAKPELRTEKRGRMQKVMTLTKNTFSDEPLAVPVSVFLAYL